MRSTMKGALGSWVVAGILFGAATVLAKDALQAGVSIPPGQPVPVVTENGGGYTPGTYANGVIHLDYTYVGTTFPVGPFATFNLNLGLYAIAEGQPTSYPVTLALTDIGSPPSRVAEHTVGAGRVV